MIVCGRNHDHGTVTVPHDEVARAPQQRRRAVPRAMGPDHDESGIHVISSTEHPTDRVSLDATPRPLESATICKWRAPFFLHHRIDLSFSLVNAVAPITERTNEPVRMYDDKVGVEHLGQISGKQQTASGFVRSVDPNDDGVARHELVHGFDFALVSDIGGHDFIISRLAVRWQGRSTRSVDPARTRGDVRPCLPRPYRVELVL